MSGEMARWGVRVAVGVARELGVRCDAPEVLAANANVVVWLRPAPVVARVPAMTGIIRHGAHDALAREVDVAGYLAGVGIPAVPPCTDPPAGPHVRDGVAVALWPYRRTDPGHVPSPGRFGAMLRELHAALAGYPGELPYLGTPYSDITALLDTDGGAAGGRAAGSADAGSPPGVPGPAASRAGGPTLPDLGEAERAAARAELARLRVTLGEGTGRALHGDAHPGNLIAADGAWSWTDFEDACAGPVEWDLACLLRTSRLDGRAAVRAYGRDPDDPRIAPLTALRGLHAGLYGRLIATYRT